jgi:hypothetical protein
MLAGLVLGSVLSGFLFGARSVIPRITPIKGRVCNNSSTAILIFRSSPRKEENVWIAPDHCNDQDPDAIWGKQCDTTTGQCQLQVWKVGPHSLDVVDGHIASVASRQGVVIEGRCILNCGWDAPHRWSKHPSLDDLQYELRREVK